VTATRALSVVVPSTRTLDVPVVGETPVGSPDVIVTPTHPLVLVLVRTLRTFLQTWIGLLGASGIGAVAIGTLGTGPDGLMQAMTLRNTIEATALAAAFPAVVAFLQNSLEYITEFDRTNPGLRA